jgi:dTDP-4-dehydrorhamnose reductase
MIIGAAGLLGKYLLREWQTGDVLGFDLSELDIRDPQSVGRLVDENQPDWIVLTAAYTDVDGCESHPDLAMETNYRGAVNVAEAALRHGTKLMFISTDYQLLTSSCILRTSWLFGVGGKCFADTILKLAATRPELDVVDDQRGCPTYARDLARAIVKLCMANAEGIVHVTNRGNSTWFELASELVRRAGLKTVIRPTTSEKFVRPAERPKYSVLSSKSLEHRNVYMPSWQEAVRDYMIERGEQRTGMLEGASGRSLWTHSQM